MIGELLKAVLVPVVAVVLKYALTLIGVQIDDTLFNTLVLAIVTYLLSLIGYEVARAKAPKYFLPK